MAYLLLGESPFWQEVEDWSFTKNYTTVGVNTFNTCPVDYRVATDTPTHIKIAERNLSGRGIYHKNNYLKFRQEYPDNKELPIEMLYEWSPDWNISLFNDKLYCRHTSAMAGINWIIKHATARCQVKPTIYLVGVDFTWGNRGEWRTGEMCGAIGRVLQYANIYRTNPQEELPLSWLPYRNIKEL